MLTTDNAMQCNLVDFAILHLPAHHAFIYLVVINKKSVPIEGSKEFHELACSSMSINEIP